VPVVPVQSRQGSELRRYSPAGGNGGLLGGIRGFHDPIGHTPAQIATRMAAFFLVILGAAMLPGRLRAGAPTPADSRAAIPAPALATLDQAGT